MSPVRWEGDDPTPTDAICGYCGDDRFREREDLIEYGGRGYPDLTERVIECRGCGAEYHSVDDLEEIEDTDRSTQETRR